MPITTALPGIAPTVRDFTIDEWPQNRAKMRGGRTLRWSQLSRPSGASLVLAWENITYAQAESISTVWDANYGIYGAVDLPTEVLAGLGTELAELVETPFAGVTWRAVEAPTIEAVKAGRCTVRLALRTRQGISSGVSYPPAASLPS
jgi:hypothetical protein